MQRRSSVYDPDRLNAFSDGIFAFAATLLVLQIVVPDPSAVKPRDLGEYLSSPAFVPHVLTFVLSFLVVAVYRGAHQRLFNRIEHIDALISDLNTVFLLSIAFLPFTTSLFSNYGVEIAFDIYAGMLALSGFLLNTIALYANARPHLVPPEQRETPYAILRQALAPLIFLLSIPVAHWSVSLANESWILIPLLGLAISRLFPLEERREAASLTGDERVAGAVVAKEADAEEAHPS